MSIKDDFFDLPPELMVALATILGYATIGNLNTVQLNSLGSFLMLIGQVAETVSAQRSVLEAGSSDAAMADLKKDINILKKEVQDLKVNR